MAISPRHTRTVYFAMMRPEPGEVLHFSEDPTIKLFVPHVAATSQQDDPYVWAVDHARAPDYWFPRQCPRALAWANPGSDRDEIERLLGPGGRRVHMIEYDWLDAMRTVELYAYRFDARPFRPIGEDAHGHVASEPIHPLAPPERVGNLFELHEQADIELRVVSNLWPWWHQVVESTLGFSGIRLRNARTAP